MCGWRWRGRNDGAQYGVEVRGKSMAAWVDVDAGLEGFDEDGLSNAPFDPVVF